MSEKLKGRQQQKRRRTIVDTLNGTGQNLNIVSRQVDNYQLNNDGDPMFPGGSSLPPADPKYYGGATGGTLVDPLPTNGSNEQPNMNDGNCPNPGVASLPNRSDSMTGDQRMQTFQVGSAVNPGFTYNLVFAYSDTITVQAQSGDTPATIAGKLSMAVNERAWNVQGNKPYAYASGDMLTTYCDQQYSFMSYAGGACQPASTPEPEPVPVNNTPIPLPTIPKFPISEPAFPYSQFQIDAMSCQEVTDAINQMNNGQIWNSWKPMYDYMVTRQSTACAVQEPPPVVQQPNTEEQNTATEPAFPYTKNQIDGMDCATLQTTIVAVQQQVSNNNYTTWGSDLQYMQDRSAIICTVAPTPGEGEETPVPPMTPVPGITTPQVIPFPIYASGGGAGGGGGSKTTSAPKPMQTESKTYLWLAIGVGSVIAYFTFAGGSIVKV